MGTDATAASSNGLTTTSRTTAESIPNPAILKGRDASCRYSSAYRGATCTGYVSIRRNDENDLLNAVGSVGPVSVSLYASTQGFQFYSSGVYVDSSCPKTINHTVLAVGYGTDAYYGPYWIIKNSWGTGWVMPDTSRWLAVETSAVLPARPATQLFKSFRLTGRCSNNIVLTIMCCSLFVMLEKYI